MHGVGLITGTRKGIGRFLAEHYLGQGLRIVGCSRGASDLAVEGYEHHCLDVADEAAVMNLFRELRSRHPGLDFVVNNAGIASMNHALLTPLDTVRKIFETNTLGTFLFCREAGKWMSRSGGGRIVNLATAATPWRLEGEAAYAASKAAVESLTQVLAREFGPMKVTVNAVGPPPIATDLIRAVSNEKIGALISRQAIPRLGEMRDVSNAIDFFLLPESDFVTGQVLYLGGA